MSSKRVLPQEELFIREAEVIFTRLFPGQNFDSATWNITHLRRSQHALGSSHLYFTKYGSKSDPLPEQFARIVKSLVLFISGSVATMTFCTAAARILWVSVERRICVNNTDFFWENVCEEDLLQAEQEMLRHWSRSTTFKHCTKLQQIVRVLSSAPHGPIVRPMSISFRTRRQEDFERYTLEGQEKRLAKMPPDGAILAIGEMFAKRATEPSERLILCVLAVLIATGLRIGEALTCRLTVR